MAGRRNKGQGRSGGTGKSARRIKVRTPARTQGTKPRRRAASKPRTSAAGRKSAHILGRLAYWSVVAGLWLGLIGGAGLFMLASDLPDTSSLWNVERQPSVTFVDRYGRTIAVRGAAYAPPVRLEDLPPSLIDAVLAIEDRRFYHHPGVDPIGLFRAAVKNAVSGHVVQGGSTLTQQLAKNLFLSNERTYKRKAQEVLLSFWLETRFSKREILSLYLNRVYFGRGAWGVEAAAQRYFGKPARDLSLGESAMIAGLLKAPNRYSPTADIARAERRATVVLDVMVKTKRITPHQRDMAFATPVHVRRAKATPAASYFVDWLAPKVRQLTGDRDTDLLVETTLDIEAQSAAESAITKVIDAKAKARGATQAALVSLDQDGAVRAMAGGVSYAKSQFNRATQARRQPGSAFKPFVYLAAIEAGLTPWTIRTDAPIKIGDWQPQNYSGKYKGDMGLITALAHSVNTIAVSLAGEVGRGKVAAAAHRMGFTSPITLTRSMPLGSNETTLIELTSAYAPFANGGYRAVPYGLRRISTREGDVLWQHKARPVRVLAARPYALMNTMLERVMQSGTGRRARLDDRPSAGKTGTTNNFRDAWFVGYASGQTAGIWVGDDKNRAMKKVTGGTMPAMIWHQYMSAALAGLPKAPVPATPLVAVIEQDRPAQQEAKNDPQKEDPLGDLLATLDKP